MPPHRFLAGDSAYIQSPGHKLEFTVEQPSQLEESERSFVSSSYIPKIPIPPRHRFNNVLPLETVTHFTNPADLVPTDSSPLSTIPVGSSPSSSPRKHIRCSGFHSEQSPIAVSTPLVDSTNAQRPRRKFLSKSAKPIELLKHEVPPRPLVAVRQEVDFPRIKRPTAPKKIELTEAPPMPIDLPVPAKKTSLQRHREKLLKAHPAVEELLRKAIEKRLAAPVQTAKPKTPPDWSKVLDRLYYHGLFSRVVRTAEPAPQAPAEMRERLSLALARTDTSRLQRLIEMRKSLHPEEMGRAQKAAANLRMLIEGQESTFT